jgi:type IV secretory pathway VirB3-like protein
MYFLLEILMIAKVGVIILSSVMLLQLVKVFFFARISITVKKAVRIFPSLMLPFYFKCRHSLWARISERWQPTISSSVTLTASAA